MVQRLFEDNKQHLVNKKVLFHQGNSRVHTSVVKVANELSYELLIHLANSPDLVPHDHFPFLNLKKCLEWKKLGYNPEIIAQIQLS